MSNHTFKTTKGGVLLEVEFDYQPAEPQSGTYPGCDESVELCSVLIVGGSDYCLIQGMAPCEFDELKTECFEHLEEGPNDG